MSSGAGPSSSAAPAPTVRKPATAGKPRFALFIATAGGLGYIPIAPGTFGSLVGLLLALFPFWANAAVTMPYVDFGRGFSHVRIDPAHHIGVLDPLLPIQIAMTALLAAIGIWSASRAARFWQEKDPQRVVIDEVSGQHLALLLACMVPVWWRPTTLWTPVDIAFGPASVHTMVLNWKYLLLGLILFRVFDIWKPFPARQAESLPGGWGIMADDWVAGVYAAIGLWIARAAGL
jgi:phosphatidylglycerophosphatase A